MEQWIQFGESWPPERRIVLVMVEDSVFPYCAYKRYASGDKSRPYFVVYHGNERKSTNVLRWADCLPEWVHAAIGPQLGMDD